MLKPDQQIFHIHSFYFAADGSQKKQKFLIEACRNNTERGERDRGRRREKEKEREEGEVERGG